MDQREKSYSKPKLLLLLSLLSSRFFKYLHYKISDLFSRIKASQQWCLAQHMSIIFEFENCLDKLFQIFVNITNNKLQLIENDVLFDWLKFFLIYSFIVHLYWQQNNPKDYLQSDASMHEDHFGDLDLKEKKKIIVGIILNEEKKTFTYDSISCRSNQIDIDIITWKTFRID